MASPLQSVSGLQPSPGGQSYATSWDPRTIQYGLGGTAPTLRAQVTTDARMYGDANKFSPTFGQQMGGTPAPREPAPAPVAPPPQAAMGTGGTTMSPGAASQAAARANYVPINRGPQPMYNDVNHPSQQSTGELQGPAGPAKNNAQFNSGPQNPSPWPDGNRPAQGGFYVSQQDSGRSNVQASTPGGIGGTNPAFDPANPRASTQQ